MSADDEASGDALIFDSGVLQRLPTDNAAMYSEDGFNWEHRIPSPGTSKDGVTSGDDYAVIMFGNDHIIKSEGPDYDKSTHFQLPLLGASSANGIYKYIKVKP